MGVQVTIHIAEDLYRRAERLARSRQREVADLLAESIHLPQVMEGEATLDDDNAIERETAAYRALHNELLQRYEGQYIALHHGELVAHGPDFGTVYSQSSEASPLPTPHSALRIPHSAFYNLTTLPLATAPCCASAFRASTITAAWSATQW